MESIKFRAMAPEQIPVQLAEMETSVPAEEPMNTWVRSDEHGRIGQVSAPFT